MHFQPSIRSHFRLPKTPIRRRHRRIKLRTHQHHPARRDHGRHREQAGGREAVRCTIVGKTPSHPAWYGPAALKNLDLAEAPVVKAAEDIFGERNIRYYGGGIPEVFLDAGGRATAG